MSRTITMTRVGTNPATIVRPIINKLIENGRNINSLSRYERDLLRQNSSAAEFEEYTTPRVAPTPAAPTPAATPASTPAATPAATNNNELSAADLMKMYQEGLGAGKNQVDKTAENAHALKLKELELGSKNTSETRAVEARLKELNLQNNHSLVANREQAEREVAAQLRNQEFKERDQTFQNKSQLELMREGNALDLARKTKEQELQMEGQRVSLAQTQQARAKERETEAQLQRRQQSTERGNAMAAYRGL